MFFMLKQKVASGHDPHSDAPSEFGHPALDGLWALVKQNNPEPAALQDVGGGRRVAPCSFCARRAGTSHFALRACGSGAYIPRRWSIIPTHPRLAPTQVREELTRHKNTMARFETMLVDMEKQRSAASNPEQQRLIRKKELQAMNALHNKYHAMRQKVAVARRCALCFPPLGRYRQRATPTKPRLTSCSRVNCPPSFFRCYITTCEGVALGGWPKPQRNERGDRRLRHTDGNTQWLRDISWK